MNNHTDTFWHGSAVGCEPGYAPWLRDRGSLTQRIVQRCGEFVVRPVRGGLARIAFDEAALLGLAPYRLAWSREVFLHADGVPVVFAHSACAPQHLCGTWGALAGLGNRSLGSLLFSHPQVERRPLRYKPLHPEHPLHRSASAVLDAAPHRLWARRSLFLLHGAPLLVTEVFLPEILKLDKTQTPPSLPLCEHPLSGLPAYPFSGEEWVFCSPPDKGELEGV